MSHLSICDICGRPFPNDVAVQTHKVQIHDVEPEGPEGWTYTVEETKCEGCGVIFEHPAHQDRKYCSVSCSKETGPESYSWKGGTDSYRGANWQSRRREVLSRDNEKCTVCGREESLHVHHIRPFRKFDDYKEANNIQNLVTLCSTCHVYAEKHIVGKLGRRGSIDEEKIPTC